MIKMIDRIGESYCKALNSVADNLGVIGVTVFFPATLFGAVSLTMGMICAAGALVSPEFAGNLRSSFLFDPAFWTN